MANSTVDIFRNNLKFYRIERGLTQEQLSELTGISTDYLSEIERGKKTPSFKRMELIAKAIDVEVYKLFMPRQGNISMSLEFRKMLGKRIKQIRESKKLSREDVAFACNFSGSYMGMIERAEYDFKISKLYNIAKALDIDICELFDFKK